MRVICGSGYIDSGEQCDDGNTVSGDGCSAICQVETGYVCVREPSNCTVVEEGEDVAIL